MSTPRMGSDYSQSGQAGGGSGAVFGDLGGPGQQSGGGTMSQIQDPARNAYGIPTHNPSGGGGTPPPAPDSVFGDLGGGGVACQLGAEMPAAPDGTDPGGQGGYR